MREKALAAAADPTGDLSTVPDTGLMEALRVAEGLQPDRDRQAATLRRITAELMHRLQPDGLQPDRIG